MSVPHKIIVRLSAITDDLGPADAVPVFHRWIQGQLLPDHLMIDVADYAHVVDGPGTLLVCSEANVNVDRTGGRLGMAYVRKLPIAGATTIGQVLRGVFAAALKSARLFETDPGLDGRLRFDTAGVAVRFNDRLLTPNTPETIADYLPHVRDAVTPLFGDDVTVEPHNGSPRELLELRVRSTVALPLSTLLARAAG